MSAPPEIVWQIVLISLGMIAFSHLLQKKFSVSQADQMRMQTQMQELQERIKLAQGNMQMMQQINTEMMAMMQQTLKKQLFPMCIRTLIFIGFWAVLGALYGGYDEILPFQFLFGRGWFATYILVSLIASIAIALIRKGLKKIRPSAFPEQKEQLIDHLRVLQRNIMVNSPNPQSTSYGTSMPAGYGSTGMNPGLGDGSPVMALPESTAPPPVKETEKVWKLKIINDTEEKATVSKEPVTPSAGDSTSNQNAASSAKSWKNKL